MDNNYLFYIICIIAIIIGAVLVKKIVGCIARSIITLIIIAILAFIFYTYFY